MAGPPSVTPGDVAERAAAQKAAGPVPGKPGPASPPKLRDYHVAETQVGDTKLYTPVDPANGQRLSGGWRDQLTADRAGLAAAHGVDDSRMGYDSATKEWVISRREGQGDKWSEYRRVPQGDGARAEHHMRNCLEQDMIARGVPLPTPPQAVPLGKHGVGQSQKGIGGQILFHAQGPSGKPVGDSYQSKAKIKIDAGEPITPIEALYFDFLKETDDKAAAMEIWAGQKLLSFAEISERSLHFFMSHRFPDHWSTLAAELRATQKRLAEVEKMLAARGVTDVAPNDIRDESPVEPNAATGGNASGQGGGMERKDQTGVETDPKQPPGEGLPQ
jgi:hypothetical protein